MAREPRACRSRWAALRSNNIQVLEGLKEGDTVILSDMSRYDNVDRVRLE